MKTHFKLLVTFTIFVNIFFSCSSKFNANKSTFDKDCVTNNFGNFTFVNKSNANLTITVWDNDKKISNGRFPEKINLYGNGKFTIFKLQSGTYYFEETVETIENELPYQSYFTVEVCKKGNFIFP